MGQIVKTFSVPASYSVLLDQVHDQALNEQRSDSQIILRIIEEYYRNIEDKQVNPQINDDLWSIWRPYIENMSNEEDLKKLTYQSVCINAVAEGVLKWRIYHNGENPVFKDLYAYDRYNNQSS